MMPASQLPKKIGKYEIRATVGKGAMGVVYSAVDPALGRTVAIKTLSIADSPHEAELRLRFLREAQAAGRLQHPNIITVHELFEEGGTAYLVMELLEGASLSSLIRRKKKLSIGQRLSILEQIGSGLAEAHAHRIVHRDLKPSNVFVLRSGVTKVLDFGVAKVGEGELTKAGTVFGTVEYMAPEQVRGARVTPQADIFSLGVVAYELLSGRNPFRADTLAASVFKIVSDTPGPLSAGEIPAEIEAVVLRALAKNQTDRFESMADLSAALRKAAQSARIPLTPPGLSDEDIVISKDRGDSLAGSAEPRVSQWSHVAAQADLLDSFYQDGVDAFNGGDYDTCIEKMSQVLDEVPVHAMALHFLASSEEKLRHERLSPEARAELTPILTAMRDAHRRGESELVSEKANALLAIDKASLEARWYRRNAEARMRGVSVGAPSAVTGARRSATGESSVSAGRSFGYVPRTGLAPPDEGRVRASEAPATLESSRSKGVWVLVAVGAVFVGLTGIWLSSFGAPEPAASADPVTLPGVQVSPFDDIDEDGTVVLQVPTPERPAFLLDRVIPTTIAPGRPATVGLFGEGFGKDSNVSIRGDGGRVDSFSLVSEGHIEVELEAYEGAELVELVVSDGAGRERSVELRVDSR